MLWQHYLQAEPPRLLADVGGAIELAVVSVNSARSSTLRNADLTSNIVNGLPPHTKILILASDREAFSVASNPWPERIEFVDMPEKYSLTIWPQDPFVVLRDASGPRLLASPDFARAQDTQMAKILAAQLDLPLAYTSLAFEGGNILSDDKQLFIGANTIRLNAIEQNLSDAEVATRFAAELGKPVVVIGPLPQPIGHIDMMLTPLGDNQLMLADPAWGARLAAEALAANPEEVSRFEQDSERNFFGRADITEITSLDGETIRPPAIVGATRHAIADSKAIAPALDGVARTLEALGFRVSRVPFLYRKPEGPQTIKAGETIPGKPDYPQITYNNALLEAVAGDNRVYLPAYGWPRLDQAAAQAWRDLGYAVVPIPGFTTTAMYGGALRCSVKVLARSIKY